MISGRQIREARALLRWPVSRLADLSKLQVMTLNRAEATDGEPPITVAQLAKIVGVLERAGVEFIPENGGGAGVRLRKVERDM